MGLFNKGSKVKEQYLDALEKRLDEAGVDDKDKILKQCEERFRLGKEAGMSDEEIIKALPDPLTDYKRVSCAEEKTKKQINITIASALISQIKVEMVDTVGFSYEITDNQYIIINQSEYELEIKDEKKLNVLTKKCKYVLTIKMGYDILVDNFNVKGTAIELLLPEDFTGNYLNWNVVSGNIIGQKLQFKTLMINSVATKIDFSQILVGDLLKIKTVSGDISIKEVKVADGKINSVSGDVRIGEYDDALSVKTIVGKFKRY